MPHTSASSEFVQFTRLVHTALSAIHDTPALRAYPLLEQLMPAQAGSTEGGRELRLLLYRAIASLQPDSSTPKNAPDWRTHRLLELRFLQAQSAQEVMRQLGLGKSQYYQKQADAVPTLARVLWEQFGVSGE